MSQQFCLKWSNHLNNMMDVFKNLLLTESMVDVTLACDGLSLKAHKIVLSACSSFFQSLFLENPCKHPIVILKDMKYIELKAIVDFMYHGEVNVAQDQLSSFMKTAETLKVKGLAGVTNEKCQSDDESSYKSISGTGTPPLKRRRGRARKRSVSNQSDDSVSKPKTEQANSDLEESSSDMDHNTSYSIASTVPLQSHANSSHKCQQMQQQPAEENFAYEEICNIDTPKLSQQTLIDNLPGRSCRSSVQSNTELLRLQSSIDHSSNLASVTSTPIPSNVLVDANQQPESPPDIKPNLLDLEPLSSPAAGPSHIPDKNSMIMDQSNMLTTSGPSNFQDDSDSRHQDLCDAIVQEIQIIKTNQKTLMKSLNKVMSKFLAPDNTVSKTFSEDLSLIKDILKLLPAANEENLKLVDNKLNDENLSNQMIFYLGRIGGTTVEQGVKFMLKRLLCDKMAIKFSFMGMRGKKPFNVTNFFKVIIGAVRSHSQWKNTPERDIEIVISNWLRHTKGRMQHKKILLLSKK